MDAAYVAGFFDGEGCVGVRNLRVRLQIAQKDSTVLREIQHNYGGSLHSSRGGWILSIQQVGEARRFIEAILPHAKIKREKLATALRLIEFQEMDISAYATTKERISRYRSKRLELVELLRNPSLGS